MLDWADVAFTMGRRQRVALEDMLPRHPALAALETAEHPDESTFLQPNSWTFSSSA